MAAIPKPRCEKCQQLVETMVIEYLPAAQAVKIVVTCHKATETMVLSTREFLSLRSGIVDARAFRDSGPRVIVREESRQALNDGLGPVIDIPEWVNAKKRLEDEE